MLKWVFNHKESDLTLVENEIHIWNIDLDSISNQKYLLEKILSEDEIVRANKFQFDIDKERFICSRGLLRLSINFYSKIPVRDISFTLNEFGKPRLADEQNNYWLNFNISHSKNMFCLAFSRDKTIGVDIEIIKPITDYFQIASKFFSDSEVEQLKSFTENERLEGFYSCWTSKEAVIKLLGQGLSFPLKEFDVRIKKLEVGETYQYTIQIKNYNKTILIELFKPREDLYGACAVNSDSIQALYCMFEEDIYSIKKFISDNLSDEQN